MPSPALLASGCSARRKILNCASAGQLRRSECVEASWLQVLAVVRWIAVTEGMFALRDLTHCLRSPYSRERQI